MPAYRVTVRRIETSEAAFDVWARSAEDARSIAEAKACEEERAITWGSQAVGFESTEVEEEVAYNGNGDATV
jgi:hypothetical protein